MTDISTHRSKSVGGSKRRLGIILIVFTALMGGAIGFAAWTTSGTGSSAAVTGGSEIGLVVTPGLPTTGLTPGSSKPSTYTIQNLNTYAVTVTSVSVTSIGVVSGPGTPACTSGNSGVTATVGTLPIVIPATSTSAAQTITVSMDATSANGCQLAVFTPNITATS